MFCDKTKARRSRIVGLFLVAVHVVKSAWEEVCHRELDLAEHLTGVPCGEFAFLVRDAEIISRDHHGNRTLQLYNGEQSDGDVQLLAGGNILKVTAKFAAAAAIWDTETGAAALLRALAETAGQHHGVYGLDDGLR